MHGTCPDGLFHSFCDRIMLFFLVGWSGVKQHPPQKDASNQDEAISYILIP
jgi:hypothetical protein